MAEQHENPAVAKLLQQGNRLAHGGTQEQEQMRGMQAQINELSKLLGEERLSSANREAKLREAESTIIQLKTTRVEISNAEHIQATTELRDELTRTKGELQAAIADLSIFNNPQLLARHPRVMEIMQARIQPLIDEQARCQDLLRAVKLPSVIDHEQVKTTWMQLIKTARSLAPLQNASATVVSGALTSPRQISEKMITDTVNACLNASTIIHVMVGREAAKLGGSTDGRTDSTSSTDGASGARASTSNPSGI